MGTLVVVGVLWVGALVVVRMSGVGALVVVMIEVGGGPGDTVCAPAWYLAQALRGLRLGLLLCRRLECLGGGGRFGVGTG